MTATVREFCRAYGIDENTENIAELIYSALVGGDVNRKSDRISNKREKIEVAIPDRNP